MINKILIFSIFVSFAIAVPILPCSKYRFFSDSLTHYGRNTTHVELDEHLLRGILKFFLFLESNLPMAIKFEVAECAEFPCPMYKGETASCNVTFIIRKFLLLILMHKGR